MPRLISGYIDREKFSHETVFTQYAGHGSAIARQAASDGVDIVVAVGGDGTVNEVARAIAGTSTALGIIPCGSGNGLARHILIPVNVRKAIRIINACEISQLDYGLIDGKPFFCTCGMGFDALVSLKFAEAKRRGIMTYAENILREGIKYKPETYTITTDKGTITQEAFLVSCANASQYGNNAYIAPRASMSDGLMDVIIMKPFELIDAPQISLDMFNKTLDKNPNIIAFRTQRLHIHREHAGVAHYDGDPTTAGQDVDVEIVPKGVRVVINPFANKNARLPNAFQVALADFFNNLAALRDDITEQAQRLLTAK